MRFLTNRRDLLLGAMAPRAAKMRLALSVRVAESFENKEKTTLSTAELVALAKQNGFEALCMRASQVGIHTPKPTAEAAAATIREAGLKVSMVTGDFAVPKNDDQGPQCLRNIAPYLDLAQLFGSTLIRVCIKKDEDIDWARKASDEAARRGIRLAHQSHTTSLFETIEGSLRVLKSVGRPNFGVIYEPANWLISGEDYVGGVALLKPYLFNVYVQNHILRPEGKTVVATWKKGPVHLDHIGLWERGGVQGEAFFAALRDAGYSGHVTIHQAFEGVMPVGDAVRKSADYLRPLL
jgi:sugar phosphate isomerase/epimerase